jgi:hypothetical protein
VTVDASSMVRNGDDVLIAGTPTYLWDADARAGDGPADARGAFGVIRDHRGRYAPVPGPPGVADAKHPRAVSAGAGGWHIVFVTGTKGAPGNLLAFDSAGIWYGRYDGRAWHQVTRVASARRAALLPGMSSDLVVTNAGLSIAYAFDHSMARNSNAPGNQGLVLLHGTGANWSADTLYTWEAPRAVQLAPDSSGTAVAVYAQAYFERPRIHGPSLFTARFDTAWGSPRLALAIPPLYVSEPMLSGHAGAGSRVAWQAALPGTDSSSLDWGVLGRDGGVRRMGHVAPAALGDRPAMVSLDATRTVWLVRDGRSRFSLRVFVSQDTTVQDLGAFPVPLDNFAIHGVILRDGTVLVATGGLGLTPADPPASSYLTAVAVSCAGARTSRVIRFPSSP